MIEALLIICSISLVISVVALVMVIKIFSIQKEYLRMARTNNLATQIGNSQSEAMLRRGKTSQGIIICRSCYSPMAENSKVCPVCQSAAGRR